jgi:hypothetical protein
MQIANWLELVMEFQQVSVDPHIVAYAHPFIVLLSFLSFPFFLLLSKYNPMESFSSARSLVLPRAFS